MKNNARQIFITEPDMKRLRALLSSKNIGMFTHKRLLNNLKEELDRAIVVASTDIPDDVVTMNSQIRLTDLDRGDSGVYTLEFPGNADFEKKKISILAPVGTAIIGCRADNIVDFESPSGRTRIRIDAILYQPEAVGVLQE